MRRALMMAVVLCGAASVCRAAALSLENMRANADNLDINLSQLKQLEVPAAAGAAALDGQEAVPGYGQLPLYLPSDPLYTTAEGVRTWKFYQMSGYKSEAEANAVMNYWRQALVQSGVRVSTWAVSEVVGYYEYAISYTEDSYVEAYEPEKTWPSAEAAVTAMAAQAAAIKKNGLTVVKALPARYQGQYTFLIYYLAAYDRDAANRFRVCRYSPEELLADENAAGEVAA